MVRQLRQAFRFEEAQLDRFLRGFDLDRPSQSVVKLAALAHGQQVGAERAGMGGT
jgi:hypothetical protein